jgi:DNA invertase Pin-like site-specific DNA recombinase
MRACTSYCVHTIDKMHARRANPVCHKALLPLPSRFFDDRAKSGKSIAGRDGLEHLLAAAKRPASGVRRVPVIEAVDRLGRDFFEGTEVMKRLYRDAGFRIVTSDYFTTDLGSPVRRGDSNPQVLSDTGT